jgi:hypothetical protein
MIDHEFVDEVRASVERHLREIEWLFRPPVRLTILVRTPERPEQDFSVSDDAPEEVLAFVQRRFTAPEPGTRITPSGHSSRDAQIVQTEVSRG